jgi:hypothetical protein
VENIVSRSAANGLRIDLVNRMTSCPLDHYYRWLSRYRAWGGVRVNEETCEGCATKRRSFYPYFAHCEPPRNLLYVIAAAPTPGLNFSSGLTTWSCAAIACTRPFESTEVTIPGGR